MKIDLNKRILRKGRRAWKERSTRPAVCALESGA